MPTVHTAARWPSRSAAPSSRRCSVDEPAARHLSRGPDRERQDRACPRARSRPRGRDRLGRLAPGLPRPRRRHRQADGGRAGAGPAPLPRPRRSRGALRCGALPRRRHGRDRRHPPPRPRAARRRRHGTLAAGARGRALSGPAARARAAGGVCGRADGGPPPRLAALDPPAAGRIHPHDRGRIVRALEVAVASGRPLSAWQAAHRFAERPYATLVIGLARPREELAARIEARTQAMLAGGFAEEVRRLLARGTPPDAPAWRTLGYREVRAWV